MNNDTLVITSWADGNWTISRGNTILYAGIGGKLPTDSLTFLEMLLSHIGVDVILQSV